MSSNQQEAPHKQAGRHFSRWFPAIHNGFAEIAAAVLEWTGVVWFEHPSAGLLRRRQAAPHHYHPDIGTKSMHSSQLRELKSGV